MRRRDLLTLLGGSMAILPMAARAQQAAMPVVGYLAMGAPGTATANQFAEALRRGLAEMGFVENRNVAIEYRWAEGRYDRVPELIADLVRRRVNVICTGNNVGALAAKKVTSEIPIVFVVGLDPVRMGLVAAINRPGGNATGVSFLTSALEPKRLSLMRELLPRIMLFGALVNPDNPNAESHVQDLHAAASQLGLKVLVLKVRNVAEIDAAFPSAIQEGAGALLVTSDPVFDGQRKRLADLAASHAIPTIYPWRDFVDAGGLLSYGNSLVDAVRQMGNYAGRILKGEKTSELPVWVPTRFEFILNLKVANTLGLVVPPTLLASADELIE